MAISTKKILASILFAGMLSFAVADFAAAAPTNYELSLQMQAIQRQILLLRIQYIQQRIADLQRQLAEINAKSAKFIDVIYPNGGETLENQRYYYIRWESRGVDKVTIKLVRSGDETTIASGVNAADGRYYWNAGTPTGSGYKIRIYDYSDPGVNDLSGGDFALFDNSKGNKCSDGTVIGKCSVNKPKLCFDTEIDLVDACNSCGCPSGETCRSDSSCH